MKNFLVLTLLTVTLMASAKKSANDYVPEPYTWTTQSHNSSESMPCGGHDVGMNVWVEDGDVMLYVCRSGSFDENNTLLKAGRWRLSVDGKPFNGTDFQQTLALDEGAVYIKGGGVTLRLWADVYEPVVFLDIDSKQKRSMTLSYESWRYRDRAVTKAECQQCSWKWIIPATTQTFADSIWASGSQLTFEHRNRQETVRDFTISYERLDDVKDEIPDPIGGNVFGGVMTAPGFTYHGTVDGTYVNTDYRAWQFRANALTHSTVTVQLRPSQSPLKGEAGPSQSPLKGEAGPSQTVSRKRSAAWWHQYWQRSWIKSDNAEAKHIIRNAELFRYMLGCNAYGAWPTKFNGGLFTFDPVFVEKPKVQPDGTEVAQNAFTPDFRCWGGGTMTAQNQRLVYWPMLKSGDTDMMVSQFDTYLRLLPAAMARVRKNWGHGGACFTEQLENFGLPNPAEYGKHRDGMDYGWEKNLWLEHLYDTSLEFCQMILLANEYSGMDISRYRPLVAECIRFFDEHYQQQQQKLGAKALDGNGKLVIYPGSGCETYKMAYNPSSTIAALKAIVNTINEHHGGLAAWGLDSTLVARIPDIPLRYVDGRQCIAPAVSWTRIQNVESPQMYPVFPWRLYGVGRDSIEVARNTFLYDEHVQKMHSATGWKQDNIWAACLGMTDEARDYCEKKFADGPYRFPAFWERGFDWAPDHNRGGSALIGLQEMLLQEAPDGTPILFPAWPKEWKVTFRLHATNGRVITASN